MQFGVQSFQLPPEKPLPVLPVTRYKDGTGGTPPSKQGQDGWRGGEKVVYNSRQEAWLTLDEHREEKKSVPSRVRPYNVSATVSVKPKPFGYRGWKKSPPLVRAY